MGKKLKPIKRSDNEEEDINVEDYAFEGDQDFVEQSGQFLQEDEYNVEQICDMKVENGRKIYFIKWDGFPHSQNTWEPIEHLTKVLYMVEQFEDDYAKKKSMQDEDFSQLIEEENFGGDKIKKKKLKKLEINDDEEVIMKKRKLEQSDNGSQVYEKRIMGKEGSRDEEFGSMENDGIMEISYDKSDLGKPQKKEKKRLTKAILSKESPVGDEFGLQDDQAFQELEARLFKDNNDDPFRFLRKDSHELDKPENLLEKALKIPEEKVTTIPEENKETVTQDTKEPGEKKVPAKSLKAILSKKQPTKNASLSSSKVPGRKKDKTGSFRNKDKPKAILSVKPGKDSGLIFLVEWQRRNDGVQPENSYIFSEDMKTHDPYFLIDYYESKMVRISKHKKKTKENQENQTHMEIEKANEDKPNEDNLNVEVTTNTEPTQELDKQASPKPDENPNKDPEQKTAGQEMNPMLEDLDKDILEHSEVSPIHENGVEENEEKNPIENQGKNINETPGIGSVEKATESSEHDHENRVEGSEKGNKESLVSVGS